MARGERSVGCGREGGGGGWAGPREKRPGEGFVLFLFVIYLPFSHFLLPTNLFLRKIFRLQIWTVTLVYCAFCEDNKK